MISIIESSQSFLPNPFSSYFLMIYYIFNLSGIYDSISGKMCVYILFMLISTLPKHICDFFLYCLTFAIRCKELYVSLASCLEFHSIDVTSHSGKHHAVLMVSLCFLFRYLTQPVHSSWGRYFVCFKKKNHLVFWSPDVSLSILSFYEVLSVNLGDKFIFIYLSCNCKLEILSLAFFATSIL